MARALDLDDPYVCQMIHAPNLRYEATVIILFKNRAGLIVPTTRIVKDEPEEAHAD